MKHLNWGRTIVYPSVSLHSCLLLAVHYCIHNKFSDLFVNNKKLVKMKSCAGVVLNLHISVVLYMKMVLNVRSFTASDYSGPL